MERAVLPSRHLVTDAFCSTDTWKRVFLQRCLPVIPPLQSHKHADVCAGSVVLCTDTSTLLTRVSVRADRHKHTFLARKYLWEILGMHVKWMCVCVCVLQNWQRQLTGVCDNMGLSRSGSNIWICANLRLLTYVYAYFRMFLSVHLYVCVHFCSLMWFWHVYNIEMSQGIINFQVSWWQKQQQCHHSDLQGTKCVVGTNHKYHHPLHSTRLCRSSSQAKVANAASDEGEQSL